MKLWGYYALHTFWNSIRKMFRSTVIVVIVAMMVIGGIIGGAIGVLSTVIEDEFEQEMPDAENREGYGDPEYGMFDETGTFLFYEDLYEDGLGGYDEDGNFIYYEDALEQGLGYYDDDGTFVFYFEELTEQDIAQIMLVVESLCAAGILLLIYTGVKSGMKQGSDIFLMADVNFLFTAPIKPQSVLLFRLTFQMLAVFAGTIYLLFQIPNLVINLEIAVGTCLIIYFALLMAFVVQKQISVGTYTYTATHEKVKKWVTPLMLGIGAVLAGMTGMVYASTGDIWKTLEYTWASEWSRFIPIVGWLKAIVIYAVEENILAVAIYFILTLLGIAGLTYLVWHMKADFYEDAMAGAQAKADLLLAASEDRKVFEVNTNDGKPKKDKRKGKEEMDPLFEKSRGVSIFLAKELLVRKRLARFGVVTTTMLWYFTICTGMSLLNVFVLESNSFTIAGVLLMGVLFFRNYGNPIAQETSMNWLFLVPESPYKKVFFSMLAGTCTTAMDLLPGLVVALIMLEMNPLETLLWYVVLITMDFMLSGVGMMLEALFPASAMDTVKASLQLMLKFVVIIFIVAAIVLGTVFGSFEIGLVCNLVLNVVVGAVAFLIYPSKLHEGIA